MQNVQASTVVAVTKARVAETLLNGDWQPYCKPNGPDDLGAVDNAW
jgi:hypothetical protein